MCREVKFKKIIFFIFGKEMAFLIICFDLLRYSLICTWFCRDIFEQNFILSFPFLILYPPSKTFGKLPARYTVPLIFEIFLVEDETARDVLPRAEASSGRTSASAWGPGVGRPEKSGGGRKEESGSRTEGERENDSEAENELDPHKETQTRTGENIMCCACFHFLFYFCGNIS